MRVLVFEDNLMWSARLSQSLKALGHEPLVRTSMPQDSEGALAAIVNLGGTKMEPVALVAKLKELGVPAIGHAGHKEKDLLALGRTAGCERLATNSELTFKIEKILGELKPG